MRDRTTRSVSLEMNDSLETGHYLERISSSSDGFLRSGVTNECLKSRGRLPVDKERLTIFVMMGTRMDAQSFSKEVGIGSSLHCLLGRDCNRLNISVSDVCWKQGRPHAGARWCTCTPLDFDFQVFAEHYPRTVSDTETPSVSFLHSEILQQVLVFHK